MFFEFFFEEFVYSMSFHVYWEPFSGERSSTAVNQGQDVVLSNEPAFNEKSDDEGKFVYIVSE